MRLKIVTHSSTNWARRRVTYWYVELQHHHAGCQTMLLMVIEDWLFLTFRIKVCRCVCRRAHRSPPDDAELQQQDVAVAASNISSPLLPFNLYWPKNKINKKIVRCELGRDSRQICKRRGIVYVVITARGYAKRGICRRRVSVCVCVCVTCDCLSHSGIVSKRLNIGSRKNAAW